MTLTSSRFSANTRLQEAATNNPPLKLHEQSDAVKLVQQALADLGYKLPRTFAKGTADGKFGDETRDAVRKFQKDQKFWTTELDGIVGKDTLTHLDSLFQKGLTGKQLKSLSQNLGYSMQAVNYVLRTSKLKAPNWDKYRGEPSWEADKDKNPMDALDVCLYQDVRPKVAEEITKKPDLTALDRIRLSADKAKSKGCGNCGENSSLAFIFLYDMGVRPLDRMAIDADHAFVVIGRTGADDGDWKNWGDAAVVCDPWAQGFWKGDKSVGTYAASQFGDRVTMLVPEWTKVFSKFYVS